MFLFKSHPVTSISERYAFCTWTQSLEKYFLEIPLCDIIQSHSLEITYALITDQVKKTIWTHVKIYRDIRELLLNHTEVCVCVRVCDILTWYADQLAFPPPPAKKRWLVSQPNLHLWDRIDFSYERVISFIYLFCSRWALFDDRNVSKYGLST